MLEKGDILHLLVMLNIGKLLFLEIDLQDTETWEDACTKVDCTNKKHTDTLISDCCPV